VEATFGAIKIKIKGEVVEGGEDDRGRDQSTKERRW
jgi:hypothetical protein